MPILNADGEPVASSAANSTSPPTEVLLSVLEQMEESYRQETYSLIANSFGYDNRGYGYSGFGRYGDDITGTNWIPTGTFGEDLTVGFRDENELSRARNIGRDLAVHNEFAINGHENRISYIVGTGHRYTVTKKKDEEVPDAWLKAAQMRVDEFVDLNKWSARQQENIRRRDRDGEVFLRKFERDGRLVVRPIEPSLITTPVAFVGQPDMTFGIRTDAEDVEEVLGYFVEEIEIPAEEVQHRKGCVDSNVKRGRPLFYVVRDRLLHAQKLLINMARTSDTQTAIAMIRRHQQMTSAGADSFKKDFLEKLNATGNLPTQSNTSADNIALYTPGSIIDASQKTEYEFPNAGLDASRYVAVLQALLRSIGAMIQQPEFMFTSDASNANLASTLVSEGPAVKRFQREQQCEADHDLELILEDLAMGADAQEYPPELLEAVEVTVGMPDVNVRDRKEEADVNQIYLNMKVKSPQTIAGEIGLDFDQEQKNLEEIEPEELPPIVTNSPEDEPEEEPEEPSTADRTNRAARPTEQAAEKRLTVGCLTAEQRWDDLESELDL